MTYQTKLKRLYEKVVLKESYYDKGDRVKTKDGDIGIIKSVGKDEYGNELYHVWDDHNDKSLGQWSRDDIKLH